MKYIFGDKYRSEALATLVGVVICTVVLSLPYVWIFALLGLFAGGIGLVATARSKAAWRTE
jgi:hypothetical protein